MIMVIQYCIILSALLSGQASDVSLSQPQITISECYPRAVHPPNEIQISALQGDVAAVKAFLVESTSFLQGKKNTLLYYAAIGTRPLLVDFLLSENADPLAPVGMGSYPKTPKQALLECEALDPSSPDYKAVLRSLEEAEEVMHARAERLKNSLAESDYDLGIRILEEGPLPHSAKASALVVGVERNSVLLVQKAIETGTTIPYNLFREINGIDPNDRSEAEQFIWSTEQRFSVGLFMQALRGFEGGKDTNGINQLRRDETFLMQACAICSANLVKLLLEAGADPAIQNSEGKTAADYVCTKFRGHDSAKIHELLEQFGGDGK